MTPPFADPAALERIEDVAQLEELLSRPTPEVVETMRRLEGDLIILGVGGKTGPSLARMARRASDAAGVTRRIIGVSRFSQPGLRERLAADGIETVACDLLDRAQVAALPDAPNVIFSAAYKFGATGSAALTWAMNTHVPALVAERYADARVVAYSSGNVYPLTPVTGPGSRESDPVAPLGEYAMSVVGRERMFAWFSETRGTPVALVRLFYANEMRYGTLRDIGEQVLAGKPVELAMGWFNAIWQGDSNALTLRCFDHVARPPWVVNLTGPERLSVREVAGTFGRLWGKPVRFTGREAPDALLADARYGHQTLGRPRVSAEKMIVWLADWLQRGGPARKKPTHFQTRDGKF